MTVYCTYCGKSFTRKEHLERHIPTHTEIKPHRCGACQLGFARRDLLQRHYSTYHEIRDPMEPLPGGMPTVAGRTPIACQNCANAKTGCDKRVPCSRCAEKGLPCAARFARRASKAAVRASQASVAFQQQMIPVVGHPQPTPSMAFMDIDPLMSKQNSPGHLLNASPLGSLDPTMNDSAHRNHSPTHSHHGSGGFPSPLQKLDGMDTYMQLDGNDFLAPAVPYQDMMGWQDYSIDFDMYSNPLPIMQDLTMPVLGDLSDAASVSEAITSASSRASTHTRSTSIMSMGDFETSFKPVEPKKISPSAEAAIPEFEVMLAAEDHWNMARVNPAVGSCPRTAIVHLECLEEKCKQEGTWTALEKYITNADWTAADLATVIPMTDRTRDRMLAITQSFLQKALEIHRGGLEGRRSSIPTDFFIVLPPGNILEYFLRSYIRSLAYYFPLTGGGGGMLDPNEMLVNNKASTLLVLLMIAQGASAVPMAEARYLSAGLIETCRISLFDMIEKDVELAADPVVLRCALLLMNLGTWSGDKWLQDIAMGQRGMYLSMLKHAGMLEAQPAMIPVLDGSTSKDLQWRAWLHRESQNRLVYNWVMNDGELSLFSDTTPMLAITDLMCPLPSPEALWLSRDTDEFFDNVKRVYGNVNPQSMHASALTPSLHDLFQEFVGDNIANGQPSLTPQHMRLLLHPLQAMLSHLRQILSCFGDISPSRRGSPRTVTKSSTMLRLEEVQGLLQRWYELTMAMYKETPECEATQSNLVLYHLISLNAVTDFREMERLARREAFDGSSWQLSLRHRKCVFNREEAMFHCGQVMRLVRAMPRDRRPCWWPAALYRATLILWVESVVQADPNFAKMQQQQQQQQQPRSGSSSMPGTPQQQAPRPHQRSSSMASMDSQLSTSSSLAAGLQQHAKLEGEVFAVDRVTPEEAVLIRYLWNGGNETPVLTRADGVTIRLDKPAEVLAYGIAAIESGTTCRVGDGIKRKLVTLGQRWSDQGLSGVATL